MRQIKISVPIKIKCPLNNPEHWTVRRKRNKLHQKAIECAILSQTAGIKHIVASKVILCRVSPKKLDFDNLVPAFKYVKDEVAAYLAADKVVTYLRNGKVIKNKGHCDNDESVEWVYEQKKGKAGIEIIIECQ